MSDDYDDADFEEEDFQESPEVNTLGRYEEIVFCPDCDVYMPYRVDGAIVRRQCPNCKKQFEGGQEVTDNGGGTKTAAAARGATSAAPARRAVASSSPVQTEVVLCAATTKAGTPCQNPPRAGSKYCSSHRGWRPPRR